MVQRLAQNLFELPQLVYNHLRVSGVARKLSLRLSPLIEGQGVEADKEQRWYTPYSLGVFGAIIGEHARDWGIADRESLLGALQVVVWQRTTGIQDPSIGERMSLASISNPEQFAKGWEFGERFFTVLKDPDAFAQCFDLDEAVSRSPLFDGDELEDDEGAHAYDFFFEDIDQGDEDPRVLMAWKIVMSKMGV
ncbi:hypothetical protein E1162_16120 [Rhodobacteraceae bacterium RKSG542]|uniref:hypothetical protein n=1 Tax=Pseudovibrio flavus TaxID=2529854 RepID=UPI0012BB7208|nr:hypothetical protein [Pseudovibrio flavus]MTI18773.1 hypothetical protein [Pseudovibrio flavus]